MISHPILSPPLSFMLRLAAVAPGLFIPLSCMLLKIMLPRIVFDCFEQFFTFKKPERKNHMILALLWGIETPTMRSPQKILNVSLQTAHSCLYTSRWRRSLHFANRTDDFNISRTFWFETAKTQRARSMFTKIQFQAHLQALKLYMWTCF